MRPKRGDSAVGRSHASVLLGTVGHNNHIGNIARALYEANALGAFYTGGADSARTSLGRYVRGTVARLMPAIDQRLSRRRIPVVPAGLIQTSWAWEGARLGTRFMGLGLEAVDWVWERTEFALDARCARALEGGAFSGFFGVEHGALASLQLARSLGIPSVVAFLSPHHSMRARWVNPLYSEFPQLLTQEARRIKERAKRRDARRDEEAGAALGIHCASTFTARSLIEGGVASRERLMIVPLGCPTVGPHDVARAHSGERVRFVWSGGIALHKGITDLLAAWRLLRSDSAELHIYGAPAMSLDLLDIRQPNIFLHGAVDAAGMDRGFRLADVLVFPTLCDGFGAVVGEAFARGLPVITTENAGAADLVRTGENGFVIPPRMPERLAERMDWILRNPQELAGMRQASLDTARSWTWADFRASFLKQLATVTCLPLGKPAEAPV